MPQLIGSTRPIMASVAMAASAALPPALRMSSPTCAASGWLVATMPWLAIDGRAALMRHLRGPIVFAGRRAAVPPHRRAAPASSIPQRGQPATAGQGEEEIRTFLSPLNATHENQAASHLAEMWQFFEMTISKIPRRVSGRNRS